MHNPPGYIKKTWPSSNIGRSHAPRYHLSSPLYLEALCPITAGIRFCLLLNVSTKPLSGDVRFPRSRRLAPTAFSLRFSVGLLAWSLRLWGVFYAVQVGLSMVFPGFYLNSAPQTNRREISGTFLGIIKAAPGRRTFPAQKYCLFQWQPQLVPWSPRQKEAHSVSLQAPTWLWQQPT